MIKGWYHNFPELGIKGIHPYDHQEWVQQVIPEDLTGKTVLDLGAWDGYYSWLAAMRGATVTAIDSCEGEAHEWWQGDNEEAHRALCNKYNKLNAELILQDKNPIDYHKDTAYSYLLCRYTDMFDIIFCFGLYYHVEDVYGLFEDCFRCAHEQVCVEGHYIPSKDSVMYLYDKGELDHSDTNYWSASESCLKKMFSRIGFRAIETVGVRGSRILMRLTK